MEARDLPTSLRCCANGVCDPCRELMKKKKTKGKYGGDDESVLASPEDTLK